MRELETLKDQNRDSSPGRGRIAAPSLVSGYEDDIFVSVLPDNFCDNKFFSNNTVST